MKISNWTTNVANQTYKDLDLPGFTRFVAKIYQLRITRFWGKILNSNFCLCKKFDISQLWLLVNVSDWLIPSRPKIFCPSKNLWKLTRGGWLISSRPIRDSSRASYPRTGSTHAKYPGSIFPPPPFHAAPPSHTLPPSTHLPSVQTLHVPKTWFCDCTN